MKYGFGTLFGLGFFLAFSSSAVNPPGNGCPQYFENLARKPPNLFGAEANHSLPEGDWSGFLGKTLRLSDGSILPYRSLDQLGADFWAHYPGDWEKVAQQIQTDLLSELKARGIGTLPAPRSPLRLFAIEISPEGTHPLEQLSAQLRKQGKSLRLDPMAQMGIRTHSADASESSGSCLPLSWLSLQLKDLPEYEKRRREAEAFQHSIALERIFLDRVALDQVPNQLPWEEIGRAHV